MAFNDTYRESMDTKHRFNVGFTSTAKGVTNEGNATINPHNLVAAQIPTVDVVGTYGPLVASGIAAGLVENHIVQLTPDPTVNGNKNWLAYESGCTVHSGTRSNRITNWMRVAETQYKLRVFEDNGAGAPDYSSEILSTEGAFNWEYDAAAGTIYFDKDPETNGKTLPLWGTLYTYVGEFISDKFDTTASGGGKAFTRITDGTNTAEADSSIDLLTFADEGTVSVVVDPITDTVTISGGGGDAFGIVTVGANSAIADGPSDTLTIAGTGGVSISVDSVTDTLTISGTIPQAYTANLAYHASGYWFYDGGFGSVPSDLVVYLNGLMNRDNSEYYTTTVVGTELRVTFGYTTHSSDWVNCTWGSVWSVNEWRSITSNANISTGQKIIIDTSSVPTYELTLPSEPQLGDEIWFLDGGNNCTTVKVIIKRNGKNIMGLASDLDIDSDSVAFSLVYYNTPRGWIVN